MNPIGNEIWTRDEDFRNFLKRHSEYYNGNPFMSTLVIGAVANMEEKLRDGDGVTENDISRFKQIVGPATGAAGDRFFWSNLRPLGILLGLLVGMFYGVWGAALFLVIFNVPTLYLKWHWLVAGYRLGPKVVIEIKNPKIDTAVKVMEVMGSLMVTFLTVVFLSTKDIIHGEVYIGALGLFILSILLLKNRIPLSSVFFLALVAAVVLEMILNVM